MRPDEISFLTSMSHFGAIFFAIAQWKPFDGYYPYSFDDLFLRVYRHFQ